MRTFAFALAMAALLGTPAAQASIAYGSLNNFDTVNDTGQECHGFEIEIEDIHTRDITYTYDWNHYGAPRITEDNSDPLHSRVYIRYESKKNPDGSWSAYTAIPSGPIAPTDGHRFTDPSQNFGGEHFGVGFYGVPGAVRYFWLVDDGTGNLTRNGEVLISTPAFVYYPPVGNAPAAVNAVIQVPEPVEVPVKEFGEPMWVKVTRTTTHNNRKVELGDLVSDDPDDPEDRNWKNGEPDEVEVEWQLLQTEFNAVNGGENGELENEPQELPEGDEVITIRYDFFRYAGPLDVESGEAKASKVGPDDLHGEGVKIINDVEVDLSTVVVVGDYIGAQMAGFDPAGQIGLIEHLQDGEVNVPYIERAVVIGGTAPIITTVTGVLPAGMALDTITGILSGTPTETGNFVFSVRSVDAAGGDVNRDYTFSVVGDDVDVEVPVVALEAPVDGQVLAGTVNIQANAADNVAVTGVLIALDDQLLVELPHPYTTAWDTAGTANGLHVLYALAFDAAGNVGQSAPINVSVANNYAPVIVSEPTPGIVELGYAYKYTVIADGYPAPAYSLTVKPAGMTCNKTSGYIRWVPLATQLGTHNVTVRAKNSTGSVTQSWAITVQDTRPPTRPMALVPADISSTSFNLSWTASTDKGGVAYYRLYDYVVVNSTTKYWRMIQDNLPSPAATVTGLAPNKNVRYAVSAVDNSGNESARSIAVAVRTLP